MHGLAFVYATADKQLIGKVVIYPSFGGLQVAFTTDGKRLIAGVRHAQLWDIATGKRVHHFGPFDDLLHAIDVSPDGKYLVTGHIGSDGRIWEIDTGTFFRRLGEERRPAKLIRPSFALARLSAANRTERKAVVRMPVSDRAGCQH